MKKKILAMFLAVAMMITAVPVVSVTATVADTTPINSDFIPRVAECDQLVFEFNSAGNRIEIKTRTNLPVGSIVSYSSDIWNFGTGLMVNNLVTENLVGIKMESTFELADTWTVGGKTFREWDWSLDIEMVNDGQDETYFPAGAVIAYFTVSGNGIADMVGKGYLNVWTANVEYDFDIYITISNNASPWELIDICVECGDDDCEYDCYDDFCPVCDEDDCWFDCDFVCPDCDTEGCWYDCDVDPCPECGEFGCWYDCWTEGCPVCDDLDCWFDCVPNLCVFCLHPLCGVDGECCWDCDTYGCNGECTVDSCPRCGNNGCWNDCCPLCKKANCWYDCDVDPTECPRCGDDDCWNDCCIMCHQKDCETKGKCYNCKGCTNPWDKCSCVREYIRVAVTPQGSDNMAVVLASMNLPELDWYNISGGISLEELLNYHVVFVNCGSSLGGTIARQFVEAGGVIYTSDHALSTVRNAFPERGLDYQSLSSQTRTGTIVDDALRMSSGLDTVDVWFDLGSWYLVTSKLQSDVTVHIEGSIAGVSGSRCPKASNGCPICKNINCVDFECLDDMCWSCEKWYYECVCDDYYYCWDCGSEDWGFCYCDLDESPNAATLSSDDPDAPCVGNCTCVFPWVFSFPHGDNGGAVYYTSFHQRANNNDQMRQIMGDLVRRISGNVLVNNINQVAKDKGYQSMLPVMQTLEPGETSPVITVDALDGFNDFALLSADALGNFFIELTCPEGNVYSNYKDGKFVEGVLTGVSGNTISSAAMKVTSLGILGITIDNPVPNENPWTFTVTSLSEETRMFLIGVAQKHPKCDNSECKICNCFEHIWAGVPWTVTKEATCSEDGSRFRVCDHWECDFEQVEVLKKNPNLHVPLADNCEECSICGEELKRTCTESNPCKAHLPFVAGQILGKKISIADVLELLKFLAKIDNNVIIKGVDGEPGGEGSRAWLAASVTPQSQDTGRPRIQDALEILKHLAKIGSPYIDANS